MAGNSVRDGYDAGKKVSGRKRHVLVDTLGLIWGLAVLPAAPTDWDGAVKVFERVGKTMPRLAKVWADANYRASALAEWITAHARWVLEVVTGRPGQTTFEVHKWRWVVERTFGWFGRYPLRGLVRCRCGAMMTPKGAFARGRQYHYYSCTTKAHRTSEGCGAKDVPAEALERAVVRRLSEIASTDAERERIREAAVKIVAADALRIDTEKVTTQHRLSEVTTQIGRLLSFLRDPDFAALDSVKLDLRKLEVEQKQLRERIADLDAQGGPLNEVISAANAFLRNWSGLDAILSEATPEELRNVLQHFVEVVEIRPNDEVGKMGQYTLGFLPGPDVVEPQEKPGNCSPVLTDSPLFREVVRSAPRAKHSSNSTQRRG